MANESTSGNSRVQIIVPWILAAAALVVYGVTLNHWLSLNSLSQPPYASNSLNEVARVSGWFWQPTLLEPLFWLVTYPFHWLPDRSVPLAMNAFSAVCATAILWLLARSISILPIDRTEAQRARLPQGSKPFKGLPAAWLPPTVAVILCGLQISFWNHATIASGEIFKLLLFAYVIRCLLEYRLDQKPGWLYQATFVFAAGMTNSWGMIGYAPLFLVALIWLRGLGFFSLRFLSRVLLCGFAGLLLYLLLPIVAVASSSADLTFWQALKYNLATQKNLLFGVIFNKYSLFLGARPLWVLALPSLLPLIFMSVRWPSYFGDPSRLGVAISTLTFHFFHAALLCVCLWFMFDPEISPRRLLQGTPLLSIYYLCALAIGYFAGYFLLVFGVKPEKHRRPGLPPTPALDQAVLWVVLALLLFAPILLVYRNLPLVNAMNGSPGNKRNTPARQFAEASAVGLPAQGGYVLSDDARNLALVRAALTAQGKADRYVFLHTQSLKWPNYHAYLAAEYPDRWVNRVPKGAKGEIDPGSLMQAVFELSQSNALYYLHPSFGYYFEAFWLEPQGLVYKLNAHTPQRLLPPPLSKETLAYNEEFWKRADQNALADLRGLVRAGNAKPRNILDRLLSQVNLSKQTSRDAAILGALYSRARNYWAVEMQKAHRLPEAESHFKAALELNPENLVAKMNLAWNRHMQSGEPLASEFTKDADEIFGRYRTLDSLLTDNGPFDEPRFCFEQGRVYVRSSLFRQAAQAFDRARDLQPNHLQARLWLAQVFVLGAQPDKALEIIAEIRSNPEKFGLEPANSLELLSIETSALLSKQQPEKALAIVKPAVEKQPEDATLMATVAQIFMNYGSFTNALWITERQLQTTPNAISALVNKGFILLQLQRYGEAVPVLTKAMNMETNQASEIYVSALFNRAIANLQSGKLDAAKEDYETLKQKFPTAFKVYYGLAEIAYRSKDTNAAIQNYELYMTHAPANTPEAQMVRERLAELRGGGG